MTLKSVNCALTWAVKGLEAHSLDSASVTCIDWALKAGVGPQGLGQSVGALRPFEDTAGLK